MRTSAALRTCDSLSVVSPSTAHPPDRQDAREHHEPDTTPDDDQREQRDRNATESAPAFVRRPRREPFIRVGHDSSGCENSGSDGR